jgi:chemotaxis protein CheD
VNQIIGISDMKISSNEDDVLITYSLGSCLGLTLWDPVANIGGLLHCMLPLSKIDPDKAKVKPFMFADSGISIMLQNFFDKGATRKNLVVKAAGCASLLDQKKIFKIGERNLAVLRRILWKNNILIQSHDVGGHISRTMSLYVGSGITTIKSGGEVVEL